VDDWKLISAKRVSTCEICHQDFKVGTKIYWSKNGGVIRCQADIKAKNPKKTDGQAGKSARTQFETKATKRREERVEQLGKHLGAVANLMYGDGTKAEKWKKGAVGEEYIGKILDELAEKEDFFVLHDRAIPRSSANIDHILITNRGVFVIDAKNYKGLVRIEQEGGILTPLIETLYVGNRKQTKLVEGVKKQVDIVKAILVKADINVPVFGALAFYDAEWPVFFKPKEIGGVLINSKGIVTSILGKAKLKNEIQFSVYELLKNILKAK
jgi:hypothetical protein